MAMESADSAAHPRPGAFLVLMVGLFLFFGLVSRIGKINDPETLLSGDTVQEDARARFLRNRQHAVAVLGGAERPSSERTGEEDGVAAASRCERAIRSTANAVPATAEARREAVSAGTAIAQAPSNREGEPTTAAPRAYVVRRGDTLYSIAEALYGDGRVWSRLVEANPGLRPETLRAGMRLRVPAPSTSSPAVARTGPSRALYR